MTPAAIFAGPSLHGSSLVDTLAPVLRPPVQDGDLLPVAAELGPGAVVLVVDGYFGAGQSLTLTEIGDAIAHGIVLFGATSLGALRAAEAGPLGMRGVGAIFESYRDGRCAADEEVCLVHDPEYRPLTVPTVNLRALCALLLDAGLPRDEVEAFFLGAASIHYTERSTTGLRGVGAASLGADGRDVLTGLLRPGADQTWNAKRIDAEAAIAELSGARPAPEPFRDPVPARPDLLLDGAGALA